MKMTKREVKERMYDGKPPKRFSTMSLLLLGVVLFIGVLFCTTRLEYMGEVEQLDFYIQQNQNLGRHNVKMLFTLRNKVAKLKSELKEMKAENKLRDTFEAELLDNFLALDEAFRMLKAENAIMTLQLEALNKLLMNHLNPGPVLPFDYNPELEI